MDLKTIDAHTSAAPQRTDRHAAKIDLEIILEAHCEWVKSNGQKGRQADLSRLNLEGADLSDTNLQNAVMNETVLRGADLLLTDLQGASLLQANLEDANLLGAKLREANLQGATLAGATGLLGGELAGTNLTFAKLPAEVSPAEELKDVVRMGRNASWLIAAMLLLNALAGGRVLTVSDAQILGNASSLPFPALPNGLPLVQFFLFCPVLIAGLYLWLHVYLQRLWEATAALPAIFQDGRRLDASLPWLVSWPARSYSKWLRERNRGLAAVEKAICIVLLYWVAPLTMMLFWARYLTLQDLRGTVLHVLLMAAAASAAIHFPRAAARAFRNDNYGTFSGTTVESFSERGNGSFFGSMRQIWARKWAGSALPEAEASTPSGPEVDSPREPSSSDEKTGFTHKKTNSPGMPLAVAFGLILCLLSVGMIGGAPHGGNSAQGIRPGSLRTWAADAFWLIGYDPYVQVTEAEISRKPGGWTGRDEEIDRVDGATLNGLRLRHIRAYGTFFAKAHLRQADLRYAYLSEADLRQANLRQASLRFAVLDRAKLNGAMLQGADLQNANLTRAELGKSDLSFASLAGALLLDAKLDGAVLYGADLRNASLERASLEQADLREANLEGANLSMGDLREAYLSSVKMAGARLQQSRFNAAILMGADLRRTDLSNSSFQGAVLSGADFSGANLQNADLRGGVGLSAAQICAAANAREAQMDDALAGAVGAQCEGNR